MGLDFNRQPEKADTETSTDSTSSTPFSDDMSDLFRRPANEVPEKEDQDEKVGEQPASQAEQKVEPGETPAGSAKTEGDEPLSLDPDHLFDPKWNLIPDKVEKEKKAEAEETVGPETKGEVEEPFTFDPEKLFDPRLNEVPDKVEKTETESEEKEPGEIELTDPYKPTKPANGGKDETTIDITDPFSVEDVADDILKGKKDVPPADTTGDVEKKDVAEGEPKKDPADKTEPEAGRDDQPESETEKVAPKEVDEGPLQVFDQTQITGAVQAAVAGNKSLVSVVTPDGNIDADMKAMMEAHKGDAVFVTINAASADQMMRQGLDTSQFWAMANMSGAEGNVNNVRSQFFGKFNPETMGDKGAKALVKSTDSLAEVLDEHAIVKAEKRAAEPKVFDETSAGQALDAAKANNKPIVSIAVGPEGMSAEDQKLVDALKGDINFVQIDSAKAEAMRRQGMNARDFWAQANLLGARGDLNNIKPGYIGAFDPSNFDASRPQSTLGAKAQGSGSLLNFLQESKVVPEERLAAALGERKQDDVQPDDTKVQPPSPPADTTDGPPKLTPEKVNPKPAETETKTLPKEGSDVTDKPVKPEPVKLDKAKFETRDAAKAFELAKKHGLPVVVYGGADGCGNCPPVSSAIDGLAGRLSSGSTTDAIVLKLNYQEKHRLKASDPETFKLVDKLIPEGIGYPSVAVYNPNNPEKALPNSNGYGGDASFLNSLVDVGRKSLDSEPGERQPVVPDKTTNDGGEKVAPKERRVEPSTQDRDRPQPEKQPERHPEADKVEPPKETVKLDQTKFAEHEVSKALELAKKNNLPVVVYIGADSCPKCPAASEKFGNIASSLGSESETRAVTIKLTYETARSMFNDPVNGQILREMTSHNRYVPRVEVFDPNNIQRPLVNQTIAGWGQSQVQSLIEGGMSKVSGQEAPRNGGDRSRPSAPAEKFNVYDQNSLHKAAEAAKSEGLPLVTYVDQDNRPDTNMVKMLEYLKEQKLAVTANVSKPDADRMMSGGLDSQHYQSLWSVKNNTGLQNANQPALTAASPDSIPANMKFTPTKSADLSPDQVVSYLKASGVDLSQGNHEAAVRALLEGKPIPKPEPTVEPKAEVEEGQEPVADKTEEVKTNLEAKTAEEAKKALDLARSKGLPVVVHAMTVICTDTSCMPTNLPEDIPSSLEGQAVFLEIPRGGFDPATVGDDKELQAINELFKVSDKDHKTDVDVQVFGFNANDGAMQLRTAAWRNNNLKAYIEGLIKKK